MLLRGRPDNLCNEAIQANMFCIGISHIVSGEREVMLRGYHAFVQRQIILGIAQQFTSYAVKARFSQWNATQKAALGPE
ncbi:hypothetical protein AQ768_01585 [Burkholderia pseudomallei]|nr:hypothetical protein AQ768_01585 [Burkholderia pseudomallei]